MHSALVYISRKGKKHMTRGPCQQNIENELLWHENNPWVKKDHILMRWPFANPARQEYAWRTVRVNARSALQKYLKEGHRRVKRALIAPCGGSADQDILKGLADEFYGIDISRKAITQCPASVIAKVGDIRQSGYAAEYFDAVASFLFFHHVRKVGFGPYLDEFHRILAKGGLLFILEPGNLYPPGWLMALGRKVFGNISGLVPDEGPLSPQKLSGALLTAGFKVERVQSVSFSHARIPVPLQRMIDVCSKPLQRVPGFDRMGWVIIWVCKKL